VRVVGRHLDTNGPPRPLIGPAIDVRDGIADRAAEVTKSGAGAVTLQLVEEGTTDAEPIGDALNIEIEGFSMLHRFLVRHRIVARTIDAVR
jgi:hypothetical protein